jgi:hypothetical protein
MTDERTPVQETELVGVGEFLDCLAANFPGGARDDHTHLSLMRLTSFLIQPSLQERLQRFENRGFIHPAVVIGNPATPSKSGKMLHPKIPSGSGASL